MHRVFRSLTVLAILSLAGAAALYAPLAKADEGMWLLTNPPAAKIKADYGLDLAPDWLTRMQRSAVNFSGASGSFVSAHGLVMTNHHVVRDWAAQVSTAEKNYINEGLVAATPDQEVPIPGAEVTVLMEIEDVTQKISEAGKDKNPADANKAVLAAIAELEKSEQDRTGMLCRVVTLYGGGQYHLYRSKRYTDIRLVFVPEEAAAFFGGDNDNFEYPRFCLDASFVRLYEDGKPISSPDHLTWSANGAAEGELTFVFGHPGSTSRLLTVDDLVYRRDVQLPLRLASIWRKEIKLQNFATRSDEHRRVALADIFGFANGRKALTGQLSGLQDPSFIARKREQEQKLRAAINADPALKARVGDSYQRLLTVLASTKETARRDSAISGVRNSTLFNNALSLLRHSAELKKPSGERLREFRDSELPRFYDGLYADVPTYPFFEQFLLADDLAALAEELGGDDPVVVKVLNGKSPTDRAREAVAGTKLADPAIRKQLAEGGEAAIMAAKDPMIELAALIDPALRAVRTRRENGLEAISRDVYARLAEARFAAFGDSVYPDATGTLRLSYGPVKGYEEDGAAIPPFTTFAGLYERAEQRHGQESFLLTPRWQAAKQTLNLSTPFNFVTSADIIGGNSGSPVVNAKGEVVGLVFDGNIYSLPGAFQYDDRQGRAVHVDSRGILEALEKVYNATDLVNELKSAK